MRKHLILAIVVIVSMAAIPGTASARTHHARPTAHVASCGTQCTALAEAYPGWVCTLNGGIIAAGVAILTNGASAVWSIIAGTGWDVGCQIEDRYIFSSNPAAVQTLRLTGKNCFYQWTRPGRQGTRYIKCQSYYA